MFSHLSGIAAIMYFAPNIINEAIASVESSFLGAVLVGLVNSAFTFVAIHYIEKSGRRKLLLIGVVGAFISLAGVGILFAMGSTLIIIPLLCYVASFAFSYGPIVWVIISEIFPTRIRGLAVSIGSLSLDGHRLLHYPDQSPVDRFDYALRHFLFVCRINPAGHLVHLEICSGNQGKTTGRDRKILEKT